MNLFPWSLVVFLVFTHCSAPNECNTTYDTHQPDTLTVVASRLWSSGTYQNYLEPLAKQHGHIIKWVNASELDALQLAGVLQETDGILLTGGADIHPARYLQAQDSINCGTIDTQRDSLESFLLAWVDRTHIPCFGICRGMQFMNVHGGGTLHPHLPDFLGTDAHRAGNEEHHRDTTHQVRALLPVAGVQTGSHSKVVSHHHQGVHKLAETLEMWACSPDGLVEGLRRIDTIQYPCYFGVQWHPERSDKNQDLVEPLGTFFIQSMQ